MCGKINVRKVILSALLPVTATLVIFYHKDSSDTEKFIGIRNNGSAHRFDNKRSVSNLPKNFRPVFPDNIQHSPDTPHTSTYTVPQLPARVEIPSTHGTYGPRRIVLMSTAYSVGCGGGTIMADGKRVHDGAVAVNSLPIGTGMQVLSGPEAGRHFVVEDRYGFGTQMDIFMDTCQEALWYGRRMIEVQLN